MSKSFSILRMMPRREHEEALSGVEREGAGEHGDALSGVEREGAGEHGDALSGVEREGSKEGSAETQESRKREATRRQHKR